MAYFTVLKRMKIRSLLIRCFLTKNIKTKKWTLEHILEVSTILTMTDSSSFPCIAEHFLWDRQCYFINNLCNTRLEGQS